MATKQTTPTLDTEQSFVVTPEKLAQHEERKRIRAAERAANREEQLRLLNPAYAAKIEMEKPRFKFTVTASWLGTDGKGPHKYAAERTVIARNEDEAWAMFCDVIRRYPSRHDAKPVFTKGVRVSVEELAAMAITGTETDQSVPTTTI